MLIRLKSTHVGRLIRRSHRYLLHRRGDGVHSPLAFDVIRQVFRNPYPFVAFDRLAAQWTQESLREVVRGGLVSRRSVAETIFRLVHYFGKERVALISLPNSHLPDYIRATGKAKCFIFAERISELYPVLILESVSPSEIPGITELLSHPRTLTWSPEIVILNREQALIRQHLPHWRQIARPVVIFDTLELEVWVWRSALTNGRYKIFS